MSNNTLNKNILNSNILNKNEISIENNINNNNTNINNDNLSILNKSNVSLNKQNSKDLKNLEIKKKNNLTVTFKKCNPAFWNYNMRRVKTPGFRAISNKVINKPLYTTKIGDLVKEYNRIKSVSRKSKKRMREKHFTTFENIDKIITVKEDLLMNNLKFKYFNCLFPQKKEKTLSKKQIFLKKVTNCIEILDNPFNLEFEKIEG